MTSLCLSPHTNARALTHIFVLYPLDLSLPHTKYIFVVRLTRFPHTHICVHRCPSSKSLSALRNLLPLVYYSLFSGFVFMNILLMLDPPFSRLVCPFFNLYIFQLLLLYTAEAFLIQYVLPNILRN